MPSSITRPQGEVPEHRRMREALEESQCRLQALFDNALDAILLADDEGRYVDANPAACTLTGYSREELLKMAVWDITPAPDRELAAKLWQQFISEGTLSGQYSILCKDGTLREIEFRAVANVVPGLHCSTNRDITERKQAETALRASEARFRRLLDNLPAAAYTSDCAGLITYFNQQAVQLWGREPKLNDPADRFCGSFKLFEPDGSPMPHDLCWMALALQDKQEYNGREVVIEREDGTRLTALAYANPIRDESGSIVGAVNILTDITEQKRAVEQLKKLVAQLAETQRLAHLGSWERDLATDSITWSDELYDIFGSQIGEFPTTYKTTIDRVHPADREYVSQILGQASRDGQPFSYKCRVLRPDGAERMVYTRGAVTVDEAGKPIRLFGTAQDVTEQQQTEERLARSHEQLRALAARQEAALETERMHIAREIHDQLGQALTGLKMDLGWLNDHLPAVQEEVEDEVGLRRKMAAMSQLIDTTIQSVREIATQLRPAMLDDLGLEPAIEAETQRFEERTGISCAFTTRADGLVVSREQATAVFRILQEALTNVARHASASHVDVRLQQQDNNLMLEITDDGRGLTQRRMADVRSLGLLGMQERAHLLGGDIRFRSHAVGGRGTTVLMRIPLQK